jgi:hypothetical protein
MIEAASEIVIAVAFVAAIGCWFVGVVNMFRAVANRKEGVPLFQSWLGNPFNILFQPALLTERGLTARRRCFYGLVGFVISCAIAGAAALASDRIIRQ